MWFYIVVKDSKSMYTFISTQHNTMRWSHNTMRWYHKKQWGDTTKSNEVIRDVLPAMLLFSVQDHAHSFRMGDDPWVAILPSTVPYNTLAPVMVPQLPNEVTLVKKPQRKVRCCTWLQPSWLGLRNARAEQLQLLLNLKSKAIHSPIGSQKSEIPQSFSNLYWSPFMMAAVV